MTTTKRLLLMMTLTLGACSSDGPFNTGELRDLANAEIRWQTSRPAHYSYEVQINCFCPTAGIWARVEVRGDSIVTITDVNGQPGDPPLQPLGWSTIDGLFTQLHNMIDNPGDYLKDVSASYDPAYGYPVHIQMTCTDQVTDCGMVADARNLLALP